MWHDFVWFKVKSDSMKLHHDQSAYYIKREFLQNEKAWQMRLFEKRNGGMVWFNVKILLDADSIFSIVLQKT